MGLISAALGALGGSLADQWKEFFYCEALSSDVLVKKASTLSVRGPQTRGEAIT